MFNEEEVWTYKWMCWFCVGNCVDNSGNVFVTVEQCWLREKAFSSSHPCHQGGCWGCTGKWEGTQQGQLTPANPRDIPHHMASCAAYKSGGRRRQEDHSGWWDLCSQVLELWCAGPLLSVRWLDTCLPLGSGEWMPCLALLVCTALAFPITLSLSQCIHFLTFTLLFLFPTPPGRHKSVTMKGLVANWN